MSGSISANEKPTADTFHVFTSFAIDIDLTDGSHGPKGVFARALHVLSAGNLVVKNADGTTETLTSLFSGFQLGAAVSAIVASGTTVTQVIAYW